MSTPTPVSGTPENLKMENGYFAFNLNGWNWEGTYDQAGKQNGNGMEYKGVVTLGPAGYHGVLVDVVHNFSEDRLSVIPRKL